jgi:hypothetical protein
VQFASQTQKGASPRVRTPIGQHPIAVKMARSLQRTGDIGSYPFTLAQPILPIGLLPDFRKSGEHKKGSAEIAPDASRSVLLSQTARRLHPSL